MVATRGRTFKRPWRGSCHSSKLKSSSAPFGRKDSWCFHGVGSSNAPLLGSTAAEGLQRIGRTSIATRWRFCGLPQSASCSENFVIPPDVFGQTLMTDNPKVSSVLTPEEVDKYLRDNVDGYVGWFWGESDRYERNMKRYELGAIIATVLTIVVAAFPTQYFFGPEPVLKWLVVAISGVATFCTTMRSRHGLEELYRLREEGRVT